VRREIIYNPVSDILLRLKVHTLGGKGAMRKPRKRPYQDWSVSQLAHPFQTEGAPLNRCELDILRYLAENGPRTKYDLTHGSLRPEYVAAKAARRSRYEPKLPQRRGQGLGYPYAYIHRSAAHLINEGLVSAKTISRKHRRTRLLKLTFQGLVVYLAGWRRPNKKCETSIEMALQSSGDLAPILARHWPEIKQKAGEGRAYEALLDSANVRGEFLRFQMPQSGGSIEFEVFVPVQLFIRNVLAPETRQKIDEQLLSFVMQREDLKEAYESFRLITDYIQFISEAHQALQKPGVISSSPEVSIEEQMSEEALGMKCYYERLCEASSKYVDPSVPFTGMFLDGLVRAVKVVGLPPISIRGLVEVSPRYIEELIEEGMEGGIRDVWDRLGRLTGY